MTDKKWVPLFKEDYRFHTAPLNIFKFIRDAVVNRHESFDIFLSGDRGMGKSACALSLALMLDPHFEMSRWCFTSEKFIDLITSNLPVGSVCVVDDFGTAESSSSRKWNNDTSHNLADISQVNRTDGLITIGTSLQLSRMELRLREGFKILCQPIRKLTAQETGSGMAIDCEMRLRNVDVFDNGSVRYKLWRYCPGGRVKFVRLWHPPKKMWREYQLVRKDFLESIKAQRAEKASAAAERKEKTEHNAVEKALKATDKEWAHEIHVAPMNVRMYKNLLRNVDAADGGQVTKPLLVDMLAMATATRPATSEQKIRKLVTAGVLSQARTFGADGKHDTYVFQVTDKGMAMIDNMAIPLD